MDRVGIRACWWIAGLLACSGGEQGGSPVDTGGRAGAEAVAGQTGSSGTTSEGGQQTAGGGSGDLGGVPGAGSPAGGEATGEGGEPTASGAAGSAGETPGGGGAVSDGGSTGGTSGSGTGGDAGFVGGGLPEGCVEVVVSPETVAHTRQFDVHALNGSVWRTESGLHIGWAGYYLMDDDSGSRPRPLVATFDPATGAQQVVRDYDVLPGNARSGNSAIQGISGSDSEYFATSYCSWDENDDPRNQTLLIGRLDDDDLRLQVDLGFLSGDYDVTDIGWDGEAFVVHSRQNWTGKIFLARVSPTGEILLPLTEYGFTWSPGGTELGYRMSTDPASGMSFLFDTPTTGNAGQYLSAHDREGVAPSWAAGEPLNVLIPELDITELSSDGVDGNVSADGEGGVWVVWNHGNGLGGRENVAAHVNAAGAVDNALKFGSGVNQSPAIIALSPTEMLVAAEGDTTVNLFTIDGSTLSSTRALMTDPYWGGDTDIRAILRRQAGFRWQDERWVWFTEDRRNVLAVIHVLKVSDGCEYVTATRPAG